MGPVRSDRQKNYKTIQDPDFTNKGSGIDEIIKENSSFFPSKLQKETKLNDVEWHKRSLKFLELLSRKLSEVEDEFLIPEGSSDRTSERIDYLAMLQQLVQNDDKTSLELASWFRGVAEGKAVHHSLIGLFLDDLANVATFRLDLKLMVCSFASLCESGVPDDSEVALRIFDECFFQHELPTSDYFHTDQVLSAPSSFSSRNPTAATHMSTTQNSNLRTESILTASDMAQDEEHTLLSGRSNHQWLYTATVGDILAGTKYPQTRAAALTVQAHLRVFLARRKYRQTRAAALTLQARYRGFLARRKYRQTRAAALTVQAHYRGFPSRRKYRFTQLCEASLEDAPFFQTPLCCLSICSVLSQCEVLCDPCGQYAQLTVQNCATDHEVNPKTYYNCTGSGTEWNAYWGQNHCYNNGSGKRPRSCMGTTDVIVMKSSFFEQSCMLQRSFIPVATSNVVSIRMAGSGIPSNKEPLPHRPPPVAKEGIPLTIALLRATGTCYATGKMRIPVGDNGQEELITPTSHLSTELRPNGTPSFQPRVPVDSVFCGSSTPTSARTSPTSPAIILTSGSSAPSATSGKTTNFETFPPSSQSPEVESKFVTSSSSLQRDDVLIGFDSGGQPQFQDILSLFKSILEKLYYENSLKDRVEPNAIAPAPVDSHNMYCRVHKLKNCDFDDQEWTCSESLPEKNSCMSLLYPSLNMRDVLPEKLDQPCQDEHLCEVTRHVTDWSYLAPFLGISRAEMEEIRGKWPFSVPGQKIEVLRKWQEKRGRKATYPRLCIRIALYKVGDVTLVCDILTGQDSSSSDSSDDKEVYFTPPEANADEDSAINTPRREKEEPWFKKVGPCPTSSHPTAPPPPTEVHSLDPYAIYLRDRYDIVQPQSLILQWPPPPTKNLAMVHSNVQCGPVNAKLVRLLQSNVAVYTKKRVSVHLCNLLELDNAKGKIILIEGAPGSGKSTLAWHFCQKWKARDLFQGFRMVVFVQLRNRRVQLAQSIADLLPVGPEERRRDAAEGIRACGGREVLFVKDGWDEFGPGLKSDSIVSKLICKSDELEIPYSTLLITSRPITSASLQPLASSRVGIVGFITEEVTVLTERKSSDLAQQFYKGQLCQPHPKLVKFALLQVLGAAIAIACIMRTSFTVVIAKNKFIALHIPSILERCQIRANQVVMALRIMENDLVSSFVVLTDIARNCVGSDLCAICMHQSACTDLELKQCSVDELLLDTTTDPQQLRPISYGKKKLELGPVKSLHRRFDFTSAESESDVPDITDSEEQSASSSDCQILIKALFPTTSQHPIWLKGKSSNSAGRSTKKNRQAWRVKAQRRIEAMRENGYSDSSSQETKQTRKNVSTPSKVSQSEGNAGLRHMEKPKTAKDLSTTFHEDRCSDTEHWDSLNVLVLPQEITNLHPFRNVTYTLDLSTCLNDYATNALHVAVSAGNVESAEFILQRDSIAELTVQQNRIGETPLFQALSSEEMFSTLLHHLNRELGVTPARLRKAFPKKWLHDNVPAVPLECYAAINDHPVLTVFRCSPQYQDVVVVYNSDTYRGRDKIARVNTVPSSSSHSSTRVLMGRNSARGATATQAVDNEYSCLHYCHRDGALEVIKRQFRSTGPQCCMKHDLLSGVVTGHTLDTLRGRLPIVDGSQHHSDFGCLSPGATGSGSQSHSELDIRSAQALKRNLVKADSPRIIEGATNDRVVDEQQSSCRDTERSVPEDIVMPVQRDSRLVATYQDLIANEGSDLLHAGDYERMLQVLKHGEAPTELPLHIHVALKFGCGIAYYKLSKRKEALKFLKECEAISVRANRTGDVALSNLYMGDIEATQQNSELAAGHYTRALEHYSRDNVAADFRMVFPTISAMYAKLAASLRNASRMIEAVQAYRNAIASADSKRDKLAAHTSLGNLFQSLGENSSAVTEYEQSINLAQELEDKVSLGWAHGNIGNAYLGLYQKDKALHHLETSLEQTVMYEPVPQAISRAYNNLGTAYQALNDLEKAEYYFSLALGQAIYGNDIPGQARVYGNIGNVLMIKKIYERAIPHYSEVLNLSRDRSTISTGYHNRGCAYYEWAESKKKALLERSSTSQGNVTCYYHGTDFTETDAEHRPPVLPDSILKFYKQARRDLERVVKYHEETLNHIKGSTKGLSLSVSLFESNSRTFHRLQDCLVNLGLYEEALVIAEQSRARSLGELLLKKRMGLMQECPLAAPLSIEQIKEIVKSQSSAVVYFSYTGARLLVWVLVPTSDRDNVAVNMIEIPLEDDEFDGKSLDYHLRYSLTETLVEWSFEMYTSLDYTSESNKPVEKLYELVAKPLQQILSRLKVAESACIQEVHEVIVVPDSYTSLIPLTCLLNPETRAFLGDNYTFPIMPSLLTMGILDQLPATRISVPDDSQNMCIVGNPTIPPFMYNHERWQLGKLPHAAREAEWVAHILKTSPILAEQATKNSILMRIMNSKVIHLATHGSASAGFLAFAGMGTSRSSSEAVDAKTVLVYPEDVEHVNISPALVVLSSCDSGRGIVKADGIIGMARAFILAGAHTVLTTLWRVPDESASVFMKFFYQYLVDGFTSSLALQKAILSIRCFTKYSQYIHWSGYQLIGREIEFENHSLSSASAQLMNARVGSNSVFPRLEIVKKLETAFIKGARAPTDVQILRGAPGINPSEALIDFIHSFHSYFQGGIFWLNGLTPQFIAAGLEHVRLELKQQLHEVHHSEAKPVLLVLDCIESMPTCSTTDAMNKFLRHHSTHIVVLSKYYTSPDSLAKEIDQQLVRGCVVHEMKPLSMIHTTQRIVHSVLSKHHLAPSNEDQSAVEALAEFTSGSPILVNLTAALLKTQLEDSLTSASKSEVLQMLAESLCWNGAEKSINPSSSHATTRGAKVREIFSRAVTANPSMPVTSQEDLYLTDTVYDTWYSACALIDRCNLSPEERLLVNCISIFGCSPVPMSIVTRLSTMIGKATRKSHIVGSLATKLQSLQLLKTYPTPVVFHPSLVTSCEVEEAEYVYVPTLISRAIWKDESFLTDTDKVFALATTYKAFESLQHSTNIEGTVIRGLICCLVEAYSEHFHLVGRQCYMEVFRLKVKLFTANTKFVSVSTSGDREKDDLSGQNGNRLEEMKRSRRRHMPQSNTVRGLLPEK